MPEDTEDIYSMCWGKIRQYLIAITGQLLVMNAGKVKHFQVHNDITYHSWTSLEGLLKNILQQGEKWAPKQGMRYKN